MIALPQYLHATHDRDGAPLMGDRPGWVVITEAIGHDPNDHSGNDYTDLSSNGFGVVVRINNAHNGVDGTFPAPEHYPDFARRSANFVASSEGIAVVIMGNETNNITEWPTVNGVKIKITAQQAADCHRQCYEAIKSARPEVIVIVQGLAPWNNQAGDWLEYETTLARLTVGYTDGFALHAYTHGAAPSLVTSDERRHGWLWHFRTYQDQVWAIYAAVGSSIAELFLAITETDQNDPWLDANNGWVQAVYRETDEWNGSTMAIIRLVALYRSNDDDKWSFAGKEGVIADFRAAVAIGYKSPQGKSAGGGKQLFMPDISTGGDNPAPPPKAEPSRDFDPRLTQRGVSVTDAREEPGKTIWRLVKARWFSEQEAGGRHHIYVEALDEQGQPVPNVPFDVRWPNNGTTAYTNGRSGFDAGNFPMSKSLNEFAVAIGGGLPSDHVFGIGMGADGNSGIHTSTGLTFQRVKVPAAQPSQLTEPAPSGDCVPRLFHPLGGGPAPITQHFGENPADYARFGMAGHTGIDYGVPTGTPVYAVDSGVVQEAGELPDYGRYVKLRHPWGESVYAHLSEWSTQVGEVVGTGERIGLSGWTGNVDPKGPAGAHLHYAMRTYPYQRGAPYDGYTDPAPYLADATTEAPSEPEAPAGDGELLPMLKDVAAHNGLDWRLFTSLAMGESSWRPHIEGGGLFQISDDTWSDWSARVGATDISNARDNARVAGAYLSYLLRRYPGNERKALWAWNWGPRRIDEGKMPPEVTQNYVSKILHGRDLLRAAGA